MPTNILAILTLILTYADKYGPSVIAVLVKFFSTPNPTAEDWAALIAATSVTARQQMTAILIAQGIDPTSDKGKAFLALTP